MSKTKCPRYLHVAVDGSMVFAEQMNEGPGMSVVDLETGLRWQEGKGWQPVRGYQKQLGKPAKAGESGRLA